MTSELDREIALDTRSITPLQKAQYTIQKNWLNRKIGHVEVILNPGRIMEKIPNVHFDEDPFSLQDILLSERPKPILRIYLF
jgi:hypothetical protein